MTSYSDELVECAFTLYSVKQETQATLRRAASTAYYALFHLLIEEACGNWTREEQRAPLSRRFDHRAMALASDRRVRDYKNAMPGTSGQALYIVALRFIQLQQKRHVADYDLSVQFSDSDVEECIQWFAEAQTSWLEIRNEQIAQDYLFSLLFKERA